MNSLQEFASKIDHTFLKAGAVSEEIHRICEEAIQHGFAGVCVHSHYARSVAKALAGTQVIPIVVVGFPFGANTCATKVFEATEAIQLGAREIDVVIQLGLLKAAEYVRLGEEMTELVRAVQPYPVKMILETALLNQSQKEMGCLLAKAAGAAFVKTSTGFLPEGGATVEDVSFLKSIAGADMEVKASGGIRTLQHAMQLLEAGATRLGTSSGLALLTEFHALSS